MTLSDFLAPVGDSIINPEGVEWNSQHLASQMQIHTELDGIPELDGIQIALVGVAEDRGNPENKGSRGSADALRHYLYRLSAGKWEARMADLGNMYPGESFRDTQEGLKEIIRELLNNNILPLIIGGSQDLTYANYRAYDHLGQTVNLVSIDSRFNLGRNNEQLNADNYLSHVVLKKPFILFNFSNIGYQTYFVNQDEIDLMERMYFDIHRLGSFRDRIHECEPILRDADIVSFDTAAIRQSDAPANALGSPNGFSGEEACAICRYAGLSDKVSSFGIYENNPDLDHNGRSSHLVAQMIWYFIEGFNQRKGDYPQTKQNDYQKFTVLIEEGEHELVFYKSHLSERWWIEVPVKGSDLIKHERHKLIPCSYEDYQKACQDEIPVRWWQAMKKSI